MRIFLEATDILLVVFGGLILSAWLLRWIMDGGGDPLRGAPERPNRLSGLFVWFCLLGFIVGGLLGHLIADLFVPETLSEDIQAAWEGILIALNVQILVTIACLIVARFAFMDGWRGWGFRIPSDGSETAWVLGGWLVGTSLAAVVAWFTLSLINTFWPGMDRPTHSVFVTLESPETGTAIRVVALLSAALVAPIAEELFFRGILQTALARAFPVRPGSNYHRRYAIIMAGTLFGLMHTSTPHYVPALIVLGILLGYLYEKRGSLVTPILVHMLFNMKSLLWYALLS